MSQYYAKAPEKRAYFIALDETEKVVGGVGVAEFAPIPGCAEVQKLYLADSAKGKGHGKALMRLQRTGPERPAMRSSIWRHTAT